jgi:uncharacterized protein (TIGR03435 family)
MPITRTVSLILLLAGAALGQAPAGGPEFEAAEVRVYKPGPDERLFRVDFNEGLPVNKIMQPGVDASAPGEAVFAPSGAFILRGATMRQLIRVAYKEVIQDDYLTGGPGWLATDGFDVIAKAPPNTSQDAERLMLQRVLAQRFHLQVHREQKAMPVYALVAGKSGPKLKAAAASGESDCKRGGGAGPSPNSFQLVAVCTNTSMPGLANLLSRMNVQVSFLDRPVSDATGVEGAYDFELRWSARGPGPDEAGATLSDALGRLGLRLEARKSPTTTIVIDRVDRTPTEN